MKKILTAILTLIAIHLWVNQPIADMYKWVDQNGVTHYSDTPPASKQTVETIETPKFTPTNSIKDPKKPREDPKVNSKSVPKKTALSRKKEINQYSDKVVIFTKSWCPHCKKAIAFLRSHGIQFEQYDVEQDPKAAEKMSVLDGPGGVPYAIIKGQPVYGFSEAIYKKALDIR
jgi:glutaredoxin